MDRAFGNDPVDDPSNAFLVEVFQPRQVFDRRNLPTLQRSGMFSISLLSPLVSNPVLGRDLPQPVDISARCREIGNVALFWKARYLNEANQASDTIERIPDLLRVFPARLV